LKRFVDNSESGRKPIMITDWDGTMKDYCSQYVTNLQPIYSALSMAIFSNVNLENGFSKKLVLVGYTKPVFADILCGLIMCRHKEENHFNSQYFPKSSRKIK